MGQVKAVELIEQNKVTIILSYCKGSFVEPLIPGQIYVMPLTDYTVGPSESYSRVPYFLP